MPDQIETPEPSVIGETSSVALALPDTCCAHCQFFLQGPQPRLPNFCRRFPPTPFITFLTRGEDPKDGNPAPVIGNQQLSIQPVVNPAGWCGEFKRRPEAVQ